MKNKVKIVILAAGKGTRMKSELPKAFHEVKGRPMIEHLYNASREAHDEPLIIIAPHAEDLFKSRFGGAKYHIQEEQLGTGYALMSAKDALREAEHIVVFYGDQPFLKASTIAQLIETHLQSKSKLTLATVTVPNFNEWRKNLEGYGRVLRHDGKIAGIVEFKDATEAERNIKEVNPGCYVFEASWLWNNISKIKNNNAQGEYYLTDIIKIATEQKVPINSMDMDPREAMAANSKEELEMIEKFA